MNQYRILNTRKRAIIALIHTVVFGLLALYQFLIRQHPVSLREAKPGHLTGPIALTAIYLIVTIVLSILFGYSRCAMERLYFGLCVSSAAIGLVRAYFGDPTAYAELGARVFLLGLAVWVGRLIVRIHSEAQAQFAD